MTLVARISLLVLAVALAVATTDASATAASPSRQLSDARLLVCRQSPSIDARVAVVGASMRPVPGARQMALKIDLYQRRHAPGARWVQRTDVPGLGSWVSPSDVLLGARSGDRFVYRQAVGRLVIGVTYRFRVTFRWLDAAGHVVRETVAVTRPCRQPGPDLVLTGVRVAPTAAGPDRVRYTLRVANVGRRSAARVVVAAVPREAAGAPTPRRVVRRLAPGQMVTVTITWRGCAGGDPPAAFVVDPDGAIDEVDETNNQLAATCPAA